VIEGALLGRAVGGLFRTAVSASNFFPLIGVAAFLGAGYQVPLAAVVFTAEATGRPGFIVPGLIAAVVAQLFMGRASVSPYQVAVRGVARVTQVVTLTPDATLSELVDEGVAAVVDGASYCGMIGVDELRAVPREQWDTEVVGDHVRTDYPVVGPGITINDALVAMAEADVDLLPVVDGGRFVGIVTRAASR
jgi:CBS domain-containing protein